MGKPSQRVKNAVYEMVTPLSAEQMLTVDDTAGGVQLDSDLFPDETEKVQIQCQDADVRMTLDDSAPVAGTHGEKLFAGDRVLMSLQDAKAAKFIRIGSTSGVIHARCKSY